MNWYRLKTEDVLEVLKTGAHGLSNEEALRRVDEYGPNRLAEEEKIRRLKIILHQFASPLIYILLIASVVTFLLDEYIDTGVILAVVILNAVIGYIQEYKAEESIRSLKKMVVPRARVIRDGEEREIDSSELVPGDIIILSSGMKAPADVRLFKTTELRMDEAVLTGESLPAEKTTATLREENITPGDQKNMAFMGTIVVNGRGRGVVVETGGRTILGRIAEDVREVEVAKTPLQEKLERFARLIGLVVIAFSALIFIVGTALGAKASEMFMIAVATAISAIPEGLPVAVTIAMAIGVARMARKKAIIRKLPAVETLGSTTVIGSDKTGTLTKNEMTVRSVYDGKDVYELSGSGYEPAGDMYREDEKIDLRDCRFLEQTLRIGLLCNESDIYHEDDRHRVAGDPTEAALLVSAMKAGLNREEEEDSYPLVDTVPFESERGYMATLHRHAGKNVIFVKGSPEKLLDMCTGSVTGEALNKKVALDIVRRFAGEGKRVLAMAYKEISGDMDELTHHDAEEGLVFSGLQAMIDPPRPEAIEAVEGCRAAGIRPVMITGDHAVTAGAVARILGIGDDRAVVLTGKEIEVMDDEELSGRVGEVSVYARVAPQHKLRITQQLIRSGATVAVTGDGVNDAPALKAAHIGIAMGRTGTDVTKEASDMVLADDNFKSIFDAVKEGRVVYNNIGKVTLFLVSCGLGELIAIVTTIAMGLPLPYIPAQILWLNLVTNGLQDVALAFEPGEKGILERPPRDRRESILSPLIIRRTFVVGIVLAAGTLYTFIHALNAGLSLDKARSIALTTMVFFQFYQAFNCRSETESIFRMNPLGNPFLFFSMIAALLAQLAVLYLPALQWIFRTVPLTAMEWLEIGIVTSTIVAAVEADKLIRRINQRRGLSPQKVRK